MENLNVLSIGIAIGSDMRVININGKDIEFNISTLIPTDLDDQGILFETVANYITANNFKVDDFGRVHFKDKISSIKVTFDLDEVKDDEDFDCDIEYDENDNYIPDFYYLDDKSEWDTTLKLAKELEITPHELVLLLVHTAHVRY